MPLDTLIDARAVAFFAQELRHARRRLREAERAGESHLRVTWTR